MTSRLAQQSVLSVVHVVMEEDARDGVNLQAAHIVDFANRLGSFKWFAYLEDDMKFLARHFFHMVDETRHLVSEGSGMFTSIGEEQRLLLPGLMRYEFGNWSRCTPPIPSAMALSTCQRSGPLTDATKCSELWLSDFTLCHGPVGEAFNSVRPQLFRICCA